MRRVGEARLVSRGGQGRPFGHELPHAEEAAPEDVGTQGQSGLLHEEMAEAARREACLCRHVFQSQWRAEMAVDVRDRAKDALAVALSQIEEAEARS